MIEKDLFYYVFSNDEKKYNEILGMIEEKDDLNDEIITDGQKVFLRDFYFRLLFRISILLYRGYSDTDIVKLLNINNDISIINLDNLVLLKEKYNNVLNKFYDTLTNIYKSVTTGC